MIDDLRPTGAPQREKGEITSIGKGVGKLEFSCTAGRNRKRCCNLESSQATLLKFRHRVHMTQTVHAMVRIAKRIGNRYPPKITCMHLYIIIYNRQNVGKPPKPIDLVSGCTCTFPSLTASLLCGTVFLQCKARSHHFLIHCWMEFRSQDPGFGCAHCYWASSVGTALFSGI